MGQNKNRVEKKEEGISEEIYPFLRNMADFEFFLLNTKQQFFYKIVRAAISKQKQRILTNGLSIEEINAVLKAVLIDTPEFFWFEGKWCVGKIKYVKYVEFQYTFDLSTSFEIQKQLDGICKDFCKTIISNMNTYEIMRAAFDWLLTNVKYGVCEKRGQTIYDALIEKKAVCKGLSKAFQYLIKQMNCFVTLREGTLDGVSKHVWNVFEINDRLYNIDVSMGYDLFSFLFEKENRNNRYRCFVVSDDQLMKTHFIKSI